MRHVRLVLLLALFLSAAGAAGAQSIPSPYRHIEHTQSAGPFIGYLLTDPGIVVDSMQIEPGPRSGFLAGIRYSGRLGGPVSGEVSMALSPSDRRVYAETAVAGDTILQERETTRSLLLLGEVGVRFQLTGTRTWNGLAPYAIATGGIIGNLAGTTELEEEQPEVKRFGTGRFTASLGGGSLWYATERLALRVEVRDHLWRLTVPEAFRGPNDPDSEWTNNIVLTVGAMFHF